MGRGPAHLARRNCSMLSARWPMGPGEDRSVVPGNRVAAFLVLDGFIGLPKPFDFSAFEVAVADAIATVPDCINRGAAGGAADPLGLGHSFTA